MRSLWIVFATSVLITAWHGDSLAQDATQVVRLPPRAQFHLFVLAGQSNMAGRGEVEQQDQVIDPRVLSLGADNVWVPAVDPLHSDKPKVVGVGLGRTFAIEYAKAHPGVTVGLIPCAHGGSPISSWVPGGYHDQTQGHPYDMTLERVRLASQVGQLKGVLWHQGESDSKPQASAVYEENLARVVDRFRAEFHVPELPFVIGQLGIFPSRPWDEHRQRVDAAQKRVAELLPNCEFVSALGLLHRGDETHFDSAAYREFGRRYYAAYQRILDRTRPHIVDVQRIWDEAQHSAFTDLVRFEDRWLCVFREGEGHVSQGGALRVIESLDGRNWKSAAKLTSAIADLRDAKLTVSQPADGSTQLMLSGAGALHPPSDVKHQSYSWFSGDGRTWSEAQSIGEQDFWLWRTTWHQNTAYAVGYATNRSDRMARLYRSEDGKRFETHVGTLFDAGYPNESSMVFLNNEACYLLLRRDPFEGDSGTAQLGYALPPYTEWSWQDLGVRVGGPQMLALPDGRLVAAVRLYDGHVRTSLCWVDPQQGRLREFLRLPSGGDTSYPGMVWHADHLWVSYYSSHESPGNTFTSAIYFAQVAIP